MSSTIGQGLTLMVAGMGTVILFLALMVTVMKVTGLYFIKHADRFKEDPQKSTSRLKRIPQDDSDEVAVIVAALTAYINK